MPELSHISCPVCSSSANRVVGKPCHISPKVKQLIRDWQDVSIVQCRHCGLYYSYPMPIWSDHDLDTLYDLGYFGKPSAWWAVQRNRGAEHRLSLLAKHLPCSVSAFLDIGCNADAMEQALERGWQVYGLDPSTVAVSQAKDRLQGRAVVYLGRLEANSLPANFFDVIFVDSVLEHIVNLRAAVQALRQLLKTGGVAYLVVPNEDRLAYVVSELLLRFKHQSGETPKLAPLDSPYHMVGFNKASIQYLFAKNGFAIKHFHISRGVEPWRRTEAIEAMNFKGKTYRQFETLCWSLGGLLGLGAIIEVIVQKT